MGGAETVDSLGRTWLGDGPGPGDPLNIRPNDGGAPNTIENWESGRFQSDSLAALGLDPTSPNDAYIFNTIRFGTDFRLEIPIPNGTYAVNLYFTEGCGCTNRHFKIGIQGTIVDPDASVAGWSGGMMGRVGQLAFPVIKVEDGVLRIGLLPCPGCPGGGNNDIIVDAIEVLPEGGLPPPAPLGVKGNPGDAKVDLTWEAVAQAQGYNVYRSEKDGPVKVNGDLVRVTSFTDTGLTNGVSYCYSIRSVSGEGRESQDSLSACIAPLKPAGPNFRRGDVDPNGDMDTSDAINILVYKFLGQFTPTCLDALDADDNGEIDQTDAIRILLYAFLGGDPLPAPFKVCGLDETPDANGQDLGCESYPDCKP